MAEQHVEQARSFGRKVDFGRAAADYGTFRAGFPERFFERIVAQLGLTPGQRALDLGTGTGTVARGLARRGLAVTAIDPSDALIAQARRLDAEADLAVAYRTGTAEALPFADDAFDVVLAGQCWHWFDRPAAAREAARVLRPGGALVVAHFDWLPLPGNLVEASEELIRAYSPDWTLGRGTGLYPQWLADMSGAGFGAIETASFDVAQPYSHAGWRGRLRASAPVKASLDAAAVARFDAALAALLAERFPQDPMAVPHRVWWVVGRKGASFAIP